jgi:hypothetical protein
MRQMLTIVVIVTLLSATIVDVVAAGGRTVVARNRFHYAVPVSGITIAAPQGTKSFPMEMLPQ